MSLWSQISKYISPINAIGSNLDPLTGFRSSSSGSSSSGTAPTSAAPLTNDDPGASGSRSTPATGTPTTSPAAASTVAEPNWTGTDKDIAIREYYALPQTIQGIAGGNNLSSDPTTRSDYNAWLRGADMAQMNRINQIKSKLGDTQAFDPKTDIPGPINPAVQQGYINLLNSVNNGGQSSGLQSLRNVDQQTIQNYIPTNLADQAYLDQTIKNLPTTLGQGYTTAAKNAGTLGNTSQSQASLNADINAGVQGATQALQNDKSTLQAALSPGFMNNTILNPAPQTASGAGTQIQPNNLPNTSLNTPATQQAAAGGASPLSGQQTSQTTGASSSSPVSNMRRMAQIGALRKGS